jgi:TolA-binding protein
MAGKFVPLVISGILLLSISAPLCFADEDAEIQKQAKNICALIEAGKISEAKAATENMTAEFPELARLPDMLYWIAGKYQQVDRFEDAKQIYEQIIRDYPDSPWAKKAKMGYAMTDAMSLTILRRYSEAKEAADKMFTDFAGNPDVAEMLYWISGRLQALDRFEEAKQIQEQIIRDFPDNPWAIRARMGRAMTETISLIVSGKYTEAQAVIDKTAADFNGRPDLPEMLYWITGRFEMAGRADDAKRNYQMIVDSFPNNLFAKRSKIGISRVDVISLIESKDYNEANTAIDKMVADFSTNPDLPETLFWLANRYNSQNRVADSVRLNQIIVQKYPASPWAGKGNLNLTKEKIFSLITARNFDQSKISFDKFVTDFKGNPQLPEAIFWIAERYQRFDRFEDAGRIYQQIIDEFPGSIWADKSKFWISRITVLSFIVMQDYDGAGTALAQFTTAFADNPDFPEALYWIAERYEREGKSQDAQLLCQKIIADYPTSQWATKVKAGHPTGNDLVQYDFTGIALAEDNNSAIEIKDINLNPDLEKAAIEIYRVGRGYEDVNDFNSAAKAYEQTVRDYPATTKGRNAVLDIRRMEIWNKIEAGEVNEAGLLLNKYVEDFNQNPYAGDCMELLVDKCYWTGFQLMRQSKHQQANSRFAFVENILQIMIDKKASGNSAIGNTHTFAALYFYAASSRQHQRKWDGAIKYFQKIVDNYPDFENICNAQAAVGWCYEAIAREENWPKEAVLPLIEEAYKAVLDKYPNGNMVYYAAYRLAELSVEKGDKASAITYYRKFLEKAHPQDTRIETVKAKIASLEETK